MIVRALTVTLTLVVATQFCQKTFWLMMTHHHAKLGYKKGNTNTFFTSQSNELEMQITHTHTHTHARMHAIICALNWPKVACLISLHTYTYTQQS